MKSKHTSGPWRWQEWGEGYALCNTAGQRLMGVFTNYRRDMPGDADRALIAAAPAMLAALIEAEQFVSDRQDPEDEGEDWLLDVLRAAIAQARGK